MWFRNRQTHGERPPSVSADALRDLVASREAEIRRLQRTIDTFRDADAQKAAELSRLRKHVERLQASVCRQHYVQAELSGAPSRLVPLPALLEHIEAAVLAEYRRLEDALAEASRESQRLRLALTQHALSQPQPASANAPSAQPDRPPEPPSSVPAGSILKRPVAVSAAPEGMPAVMRLAETLDAASRGVLERLASGLSRLDRLGDEAAVQRMVGQGLLRLEAAHLQPGQAPVRLVRWAPPGRSLAEAIGLTPAEPEADRWEARHGELRRGLVATLLLEAWQPAGWQAREATVQTNGRLAPDLVVARDGHERQVWVWLEEDTEASKRLAAAVAESTDPHFVVFSRQGLQEARRSFSHYAVRHEEVSRRATILWVAIYDEALKDAWQWVLSGPPSAARLKGSDRDAR